MPISKHCPQCLATRTFYEYGEMEFICEYCRKKLQRRILRD